jgi:Chlorophyll A-B binding protein
MRGSRQMCFLVPSVVALSYLLRLTGYDFLSPAVAAIEAVPALGWAQMFFLIGAVDYYGFLKFDSGIPDLAPEELEKRTNSEITHGRLAMLATLELLRHDSQNLASPGFDGLDNLITGLPFLYT